MLLRNRSRLHGVDPVLISTALRILQSYLLCMGVTLGLSLMKFRVFRDRVHS